VINNGKHPLEDNFIFTNLSEPDDGNNNMRQAARTGIIAGIVSATVSAILGSLGACYYYYAALQLQFITFQSMCSST
jgi:hypothetical protein